MKAEEIAARIVGFFCIELIYYFILMIIKNGRGLRNGGGFFLFVCVFNNYAIGLVDSFISGVFLSETIVTD